MQSQFPFFRKMKDFLHKLRKDALFIFVLSAISFAAGSTALYLINKYIVHGYYSTPYLASKSELARFKKIGREFVLATYQFENPSEIDRKLARIRSSFEPDFYLCYINPASDSPLYQRKIYYEWGKITIIDMAAEKKPDNEVMAVIVGRWEKSEGGYVDKTPVFIAITFDAEGKIKNIRELN